MSAGVEGVLDVVAGVFLVLAAMLSLLAAVGTVRFPDLLTRMHAATKPQTLGILCVAIGLALRLRTTEAVGMLVLIALFQLLTAPVSAHMIGRTAFRTSPLRDDLLVVDEHTGDETDDQTGDRTGDRTD